MEYRQKLFTDDYCNNPLHDVTKTSRNSLRVLGWLAITLGFVAIAVGVGIYRTGLLGFPPSVSDLIHSVAAVVLFVALIVWIGFLFTGNKGVKTHGKKVRDMIYTVSAGFMTVGVICFIAERSGLLGEAFPLIWLEEVIILIPAGIAILVKSGVGFRDCPLNPPQGGLPEHAVEFLSLLFFLSSLPLEGGAGGGLGAELSDILPFYMIVGDITDKVSVIHLLKEDVPCGLFSRIVSNILHAGSVFFKMFRCGFCRKCGNVQRNVINHLMNISHSVLVRAKIFGIKQLFTQYIKIIDNKRMKYYNRFYHLRIRCSISAINSCGIRALRLSSSNFFLNCPKEAGGDTMVSVSFSLITHATRGCFPMLFNNWRPVRELLFIITVVIIIF
jgi:hypothetical protein